ASGPDKADIGTHQSCRPVLSSLSLPAVRDEAVEACWSVPEGLVAGDKLDCGADATHFAAAVGVEQRRLAEEVAAGAAADEHARAERLDGGDRIVAVEVEAAAAVRVVAGQAVAG